MRFTPEHFSTAAQAQSVPELFSIYGDRQCKKFFSTGWGLNLCLGKSFSCHEPTSTETPVVCMWVYGEIYGPWRAGLAGIYYTERDERDSHEHTNICTRCALCSHSVSSFIFACFVHFCWVVHESCVACMCLDVYICPVYAQWYVSL